MADPVIVNTPSGGDNAGNGMGFLVGVILLLIVLFLFFWYGLPAIRSMSGSGSPQINVPGKIDVNVNKK